MKFRLPGNAPGIARRIKREHRAELKILGVETGIGKVIPGERYFCVPFDGSANCGGRELFRRPTNGDRLLGECRR